MSWDFKKSRQTKDSTQVAVSKTKANGVEIIYTVPASKVFYMTAWTLGLTGSAVDLVHLKVRNVADTEQYTIMTMGAETTLLESQTQSGSFDPPLEIAAGWDVILDSDAANADGTAFIHGYTENA